ncbi:MAG: Asp-tRNA(Asn)/Glu-tRNA(Gln) amidotransferase subunit GatC [Gammaproteobacteria bacterium]|nr:Asp-tRNA(Asn)/Glu-tRNA(Gln) amidotransferase subunit GatC [Gammaproteobacteria bacterium]
MELTRDEIYKTAHLARLAISETDVAKYVIELSKTMTLIANLEQADTTSVSVMAHPLNQVQRLRADVVTEVDQRDYLQKLAPKVEAGLYLVPQVIE